MNQAAKSCLTCLALLGFQQLTSNFNIDFTHLALISHSPPLCSSNLSSPAYSPPRRLACLLNLRSGLQNLRNGARSKCFCPLAIIELTASRRAQCFSTTARRKELAMGCRRMGRCLAGSRCAASSGALDDVRSRDECLGTME
jgi:hypothetical protein